MITFHAICIYIFSLSILKSYGIRQTFLSTVNSPWMEARTLCDIVTPKFDNNGMVKNDLSAIATNLFAWVDGYVSVTKWIQFEGCVVITSVENVISKIDLTFHFGDIVLECYTFCNRNSFGIMNLTCYCLSSIDRNYDIHDSLCQAEYCSGHPGPLCGLHECLCMYKIDVSSQEIRLNDNKVDNCLKLYCQKNSVDVRTDKCNASITHLGITGKGSLKFLKDAPFWEAAKLCQSEKCILPIKDDFMVRQVIKDGYYWLNTFRLPIIVSSGSRSFGSTVPKQCIAIQIQGNGDQLSSIRNCSEHLPAMCISNGIDNSAVITGAIIIGVVATLCVIVCIITIVFTVALVLRCKNVPDSNIHEPTQDVVGEVCSVNDSKGNEYHEIQDVMWPISQVNYI